MDPKIQSYFIAFPEEVQVKLNQIRALILDAAPEAVESFSYGMPAYKLNKKPLIYFAAYKNHIGLYATPSAHAAFAEELSSYKKGKGSVQFPLNEELPLGLILKILKFNINRIIK